MFTHIKHEEKPSPLPIAQRKGSFGLGLLSFSSAFSRRLKIVHVGRLFSLLFPSFHCPLLVLESLTWITPKQRAEMPGSKLDKESYLVLAG